MKRLKLRKEVKFITCLLCFALLLGFLPTMNVIAEDPSQQPHSVTVSQDNDVLYTNKYVELSASYDGSEEAIYQWQIYLANADTWVNIADVKDSVLKVTYAMVANTAANDSAQLRCNVIDGDSSTVSDAVVLNISEPVVNEVEEITSDEPVTEEPLATSGYSLSRVSRNTSNYDISPADSNASDVNIQINYTFEDGNIAADPYLATVTSGSAYSDKVNLPVVVGYEPYYENQLLESTFDINIPNVENDCIYNIVYKAAFVTYSVCFWEQNVDDDQYTESKTIVVDPDNLNDLDASYKRKTGEVIPNNLSDLYKPDGFYSLKYDPSITVAADGSTVINIYYDRYYYLMNFNLDGGYGVEPVYARFGYTIGEIGTPIKSGYSFSGWTLNGENVELPETMPAINTTYVAVWTANDTAKLTVVFWGENANDEEYSYIKSTQVNVKPGSEFTYSESDTLICALEEHTHSIDKCYEITCTQEEHIHNDSCYTCGIENHTHNTSCYTGVGSPSSAGTGSPNNPSNGTVSREAWSWDGKVIYINGTWYKYTGNTQIGQIAPVTCGKTEITHVHTDDCLGCGKTEHSHSLDNNCYNLTCDKTEHSHTSDCYMSGAGLDSKLWVFEKSDTVNVAADGSSVVNVYYKRTDKTLTFKYNYSDRNRKYQSTETITAKWGSDISEKYKKVASNAGSTFWTEKTDGSGPYTNYIGVMPEKSITYYNRGATGRDGTMTYNGQDLNGEYTIKLFEVSGVGGYDVTIEDRYIFEGFTYHHGTNIGSDCKGATFYYTRNKYKITFNDGYNDVKTESVLYQQTLNSYSSYVPDVPEAYESGSVYFGGWYLNPECTGKEYILDEHTMPANNVLLYAKWIPVQHTVKFYLDRDAYDNKTKLETHQDVTVYHGSLVDPTPNNPENGEYTFVSWFYLDNGVEKAFDFANMPVKKDLEVYGKWTSNTLKKYVIEYVTKINGETVKIADDTIGFALAGQDKTFEAKTGNALDPGYQEGYFPLTSSHTITKIDIKDSNDDPKINCYQFEYVAKESVDYKVKYLEKDSNIELHPSKEESTKKAAVTETYEYIKGYVPDAYQKTLILTATAESSNELIFWYEKDELHAPVRVTYYVQNQIGDDYSVYRTIASTSINIGSDYTAEVIDVTNCEFEKAIVNNISVDPKQKDGKTVITEKVPEEGLDIAVYYKRKVSDLTINKKINDDTDPQQDFVFKVSSRSLGQPIIVVIHAKDFKDGTGSVVISDLRVGTEVLVEEITDWSWRYTVNTINTRKTISNDTSSNSVTFINTLNNNKWLSSDNKVPNQFELNTTE